MIGLLFEIFTAIIAALYITIHGNVVVNTNMTDLKFRHVKKLNGSHMLLIDCQQFKHRCVYERWWLINRTRYTYRVEILECKDSTMVKSFQRTYPHMGPRILRNTTYPHRLAVNACIDEIIKELYHVKDESDGRK